MTLDEAIRRNPYNPKKGNEAAYCRYLRYNVDGWYQLDSKEVLNGKNKVTKNYPFCHCGADMRGEEECC